MEQISKTLGLHHIAEDIFKLLDEKTIIDCRLVNNSWKNILDQPMFWLKKLQKLSKIMPENFHYQSWKSLSQELDDDDPILENEFALILSKIYMRKRALLPLEVVVELATKEEKYSNLANFLLVNVELNCKIDVNIVNKNSKEESTFKGLTPIHLAALNGFTEAVTKLAAKYEEAAKITSIGGMMPLHCAARNGHLEIVEFLAGFTDNPNSPNNDGNTPLHVAASNGHLNVVKFLYNLTDNPDVPNNNGETPFEMAKRNRYIWNFENKYCELLKLEKNIENSMIYLENDMKTRFEDEIRILRQQRKRLVLSSKLPKLPKLLRRS